MSENRGRTRAGMIERMRMTFLWGILFLSAGAVLGAQEPSLEQLPGLRERAVVMRIVSRIVEQNQEENQQVVWNEENVKVTFPGRPVGLKLLGADLVVAVQFTPFLRSNGQHILVAQGQIWINVPNEGISYHSTMQTIPLEFNEQVYFFPLGSMKARGEAQIEIQLVVEPYSGSSGEEGGPEMPRRGSGPHHEGASPMDRGMGMKRNAPDEKVTP